MPLTEEEHRIITHTLTGSNGTIVYRNWYATGPDDDAMPILIALESRGLMKKGKEYNADGGVYYHATQAGAASVGLSLI